MRKRNVNEDFIKSCFADSVFSLMNNSRIEDISISNVCKKSGFGRTTFYKYFKSINGLEDVVLEDLHKSFNKYYEENKDRFNSKKVPVMINFIYSQKNKFKLLTKQKSFRVLFTFFMQVLGPNTDDPFIVNFFRSFIASGFMGVLLVWFESDFDKSPEDIKKLFDETFKDDKFKFSQYIG